MTLLKISSKISNDFRSFPELAVRLSKLSCPTSRIFGCPPCHFYKPAPVASRQDRKPRKDIANAARLYFGRPESQPRIRGRRTVVSKSATAPYRIKKLVQRRSQRRRRRRRRQRRCGEESFGGVWPSSKTRDARGFIARKS